VSKVQDNPMVNESEIVVLPKQFWMYAEKEKVLGEEEGRTNLGGRENVKAYRKC